MERKWLVRTVLILGSFVPSLLLAADGGERREKVRIHIPDSSTRRTEDEGVKAHTNHVVVLNPESAKR